MVKNPSGKQVVVVDDDRDLCQAIRSILERAGNEVQVYYSAEACEKCLESLDCHLLITDVKMAGMDGFELMSRVKHVRPGLPVIMITGYGDIPMAVKAIKQGANSFIEKPLEKKSLLQAVSECIRPQVRCNLEKGKSLSQAEERVLELILAGHKNRQIAEILCRSIRTVEDHRRNIMRKLDVKNIVELVKVVLWHGMVT
jgi:FixJ family two-component response regulator